LPLRHPRKYWTCAEETRQSTPSWYILCSPYRRSLALWVCHFTSVLDCDLPPPLEPSSKLVPCVSQQPSTGRMPEKLKTVPNGLPPNWDLRHSFQRVRCATIDTGRSAPSYQDIPESPRIIYTMHGAFDYVVAKRNYGKIATPGRLLRCSIIPGRCRGLRLRQSTRGLTT